MHKYYENDSESCSVYTQQDTNYHLEERTSVHKLWTSKVRDFHTLHPRPYDYEKSNKIRALHFGQRKLLMAEIEFLTHFYDSSKTVVYVGAAPGPHIDLLSKFFPEHEFYLYDPRPFASILYKNPNIHMTRAIFTTKDAFYWGTRDHVYISDIRRDSSDEDKEDYVAEDNALQLLFGQIMSPQASLIKFRVPRIDDPSPYFYLNGEVKLPVWARKGSAEVRLWVTDFHFMRIWRPDQFEDMMAYFNQDLRTHCFGRMDGNDISGYCACYDCNAEIDILLNYIALTIIEVELWAIKLMIDGSLGSLSSYVCKHCRKEGQHGR